MNVEVQLSKKESKVLKSGQQGSPKVVAKELEITINLNEVAQLGCLLMMLISN